MDTPIAPPTVGFEDPSPPAPEQPQRTAAGWFLLFAIFGIYVSLMILSTHLVGPAEKNPYEMQEMTVKAAMHQKSIFSFISSGQKTGTTTLKQPTSAADPETIRTLEGKKSDPRADRLLIATREEFGLKQDENDIQKLADSKDPVDKAFATIYQSKTLSKEQAQSLEKQLPNKEFAYRLAKVHASDKAGDASEREKMAPAWKSLTASIMVLGAMGMALVGVLLWALYISYRSSGRWIPLGHPAEPISKGAADRYAYRAGMLMTAFLVLEFMAGAALRHTSLALQTFGIFALVIAAVVAIHRIPALGMNIPLSKIGVTKKNFGINVLWGIGGYIAALPILGICIIIGTLLMKVFGQSTHPITEIIAAGPTAPTILALYFSAAMAAPFWEEIMFRGTLLPAIAGVTGKPALGIIVSSFVFAAIHPQGIPLWLALGSIGAMNACLAYQTKSLIPCMVLHALNNGLVLTLALLMS